MDLARLTPHLGALLRVGNGLGSCVQIALSARREGHSGLLPRLEEAQCGTSEWQEEGEPPPTRTPGHDEHSAEDDSHAEQEQPEREPLAPLAPADVPDADGRRRFQVTVLARSPSTLVSHARQGLASAPKRATAPYQQQST